MKLNVTPVEEKERLAVQVKESVMDDLRAYTDAVNASNGNKVTQAQVVEGILEQFMDGDKDFKQYKKKLSESSKGQDSPSTYNGVRTSGHI